MYQVEEEGTELNRTSFLMLLGVSLFAMSLLVVMIAVKFGEGGGSVKSILCLSPPQYH